MGRRVAMVVAGMLAAGAATGAWAASPQNDMRVRTQQVHLAMDVPVPCVAVEAERGVAVIVLSRDELDRLAAVRTRADASEAARLAFIAGMRARALLGQLGPARDARGCSTVQGAVPFDTRYLVGQLLEQGHATVFTRRLKLPEPALRIRQVDTLLNGWEEFRLLDGTVIWGYGTWVS